eukprot:13879346-Alexandrium_andersonii.AAC.1
MGIRSARPAGAEASDDGPDSTAGDSSPGGCVKDGSALGAGGPQALAAPRLRELSSWSTSMLAACEDDAPSGISGPAAPSGSSSLPESPAQSG